MTRLQILRGAFLFAFIVALIMVPLQHRVMRLLRTRHGLTYEHLGRPGWGNARAWWSRGYWRWFGFLFGRNYIKLQDPELNRFAGWLLVLNGVIYALSLVILWAFSCIGLC